MIKLILGLDRKLGGPGFETCQKMFIDVRANVFTNRPFNLIQLTTDYVCLQWKMSKKWLHHSHSVCACFLWAMSLK